MLSQRSWRPAILTGVLARAPSATIDSSLVCTGNAPAPENGREPNTMSGNKIGSVVTTFPSAEADTQRMSSARPLSRSRCFIARREVRPEPAEADLASTIGLSRLRTIEVLNQRP